jgi:hypothetical protein
MSAAESVLSEVRAPERFRIASGYDAVSQEVLGESEEHPILIVFGTMRGGPAFLW